MKYLDRTSVKNKNKKRTALVVLIFIIILMVGFFFRNQVATIGHYALAPVNGTFKYVSKPFKNFSSYFSSKIKLEQDNYNLSDANKNLEIEILSMKAVKDENKELRDILAIEELKQEDRMFAQVILTPPFSPFDTFVAKLFDIPYMNNDVDNLIGKHVLIKNSVVGEISEVHNNNIIVKLYSNYGNKIPVKINNEILAEAEGQGGLAFKITLPKNVEVNKGTPVFSVEQPGSVLGSIKNIEVTEAGSFQSLYFQYLFTYSDFTIVEIAI